MQIMAGNKLIEEFGIDYFKEGSTFGALSEAAIRYLLEEGKSSSWRRGNNCIKPVTPVIVSMSF